MPISEQPAGGRSLGARPVVGADENVVEDAVAALTFGEYVVELWIGSVLSLLFLLVRAPPTPPLIAATTTTTASARISQNVRGFKPHIRRYFFEPSATPE